MRENRVSIIIDGGYLEKVLRKYFDKTNVDFIKLNKKLCENSELFRTYYYYCYPYQSSQPTEYEKKRYRNKQYFINALKKIDRFQLRRGKLVKRGDGQYFQKRVDILMAIDVVKLSSTGRVEEIILITGDDDLTPAVKEAKDFGVIVKLLYYPDSVSNELFDACDERIKIDQELINNIKRDKK